MSGSWARCGCPQDQVGWARLPAPQVRPYRRAVPLYLVPRTRAWLSEEEVAAAADCVPAVNETLRGELRWIRTYVMPEDDGTFSTVCLYEARDPDVLRRHADALGLPVDAIKRVTSTIVASPDPAPSG